MLGDVAVAVHPDDERYQRPRRQARCVLPIVDIEIPIIADEYADPAFGTGVVKITPAHDANDFEVGKRHELADAGRDRRARHHGEVDGRRRAACPPSFAGSTGSRRARRSSTMLQGSRARS